MCRISPRSCEVSVTGFHYLVKGQSVPFSGGLSPNQEDCPWSSIFFLFFWTGFVDGADDSIESPESCTGSDIRADSMIER